MTWTCPNCGFTLKVLPKGGVERFTCKCQRVNQPSPPGLLAKLMNFGEAVVEHVCTGMETVTDEQRAARLTICHGCELFNGQICTHAKCGCTINGERMFLDKLSWASSKCPLDKWPENIPPP